MTKTKAKWFRNPGSRPVYEPQRPYQGREPYIDPYPGEKRQPYHSPPADPNRRYKEEPGYDGRFKPKPEPKPPVNPQEGRAARALERQAERVRGGAFRAGLGTFMAAMDAADYIEPWVFPNYTQPPVLPSNYIWCKGPFPYSARWYSKPFFEVTGTCLLNPPVAGQAPGPVTDGVAQGRPVCYWSRQYYANATLIRQVTMGVVTRTSVQTPQQRAAQPWAWSTAGDPNVIRLSPGKLVPGFGTTVRPVTSTADGPAGFLSPDSPYELDHAWQYETTPGGLSGGIAGPRPSAPAAPPPVAPPAGRQPPAKGEKQGKVITKSVKVALALYHALDRISESAEVVDAIYEALPESVRKRWEKDRFPDAHWYKDPQTGKWQRAGVTRPGDSFGQYGIDGADWKLQALWYNWDKVDLVQAVRNIIKNELSDRIIGGYQRHLPRNAGNAHNAGEREFAKWIDEYLAEELGL